MPSFSARLVAPLVWLAVLAACSGNGDGRGDTSSGGGNGRKGEPAAEFAFAVTGAEVQAMAPQPAAFPDDLKAGVKAGLDAYLGLAVVEPLRSGKPPTGLEAAFTPAALGRLTAAAADRAAVLEEGPSLHGELRQDRADAALTALTAPGGDIVLVTAKVDVAHTVKVGDRSVAVVRSGEFVLVPDAGSWRIDAYDLRTARDTQPAGAK